MVRTNPVRTIVLAAVAVTLPAAVAAADTLWIGESATNPIQTAGVKVQSATADGLTFASDAGGSRTVPMAKIQRVNVDGDTALNGAEDAFASHNWAAAASGYQAVLGRASTKDWEKARAGQRLVTAARAANKYDAEVAGYVAVAQTTPAAAAASRPPKPADDDPGLDAAQASVTAALAGPKLDGSAKVGLLGVALDIARAKHDEAAVASTLQQMVAAGGGSAADQATLKIATASVDVDKKQYAQAAAVIEQNRAAFTDPDQQVDALYVLAQAKDGLDGDKPEPAAVQDVAIAYMRVVTAGNVLADHGRPHVAESLVRVGQLEEKLKQLPEAMGVYTKVATDPAYAAAKGPQAAAKAAVDRLKRAGVGTAPKP